MKPLIGITCSGDPQGDRLYVSRGYPGAVAEAGGLPLLLPELAELASVYLKNLDGLILSGGGDVDPLYFNEEPLPDTGEISPVRDDFELKLARLALTAGLPLLGICRGVQIMNIAAGGTICQDISMVTQQPLKHRQKAPRWYPTHSLELLPGSLLAGLFGGVKVRVNSFHHQAVDRVARGFMATAWAPDGVIEGIEAEKVFAVGVQFHPEDMWEKDRTLLGIFKALVEAATLKNRK